MIDLKIPAPEYMRVTRSAFLIDPSGAGPCTWLTVNAPGHTAEVLVAPKALA